MIKVTTGSADLGFVSIFPLQPVEVKGDFSFESQDKTKYGVNVFLTVEKADAILQGGALRACAEKAINKDAFVIEGDQLTFKEDKYKLGGTKKGYVVAKRT